MVVVAACAALMFIRVPVWVALCFGVGAPVATYLSLVWMMYVGGAVLQNTPANAVLVPGLTRRVRQATVAMFVPTMLAWTLVAVALPHTGLIVLGAAYVLVCAAMTRGGRTEGAALVIVAQIVMVAGGAPLAAWIEHASVMAALALLIALLGWRTLVTILPGGSQRPSMRNQRARALRVNETSIKGGMRALKSSGGRRRLYRRLLAADIGAGIPARLMLHALGPGNHRYDQAPIMAVCAIGAIGLKLLVGDAAAMICMLSIGLAPFASAYRFAASIPNGAPEQALVRLAPRMPNASSLNRVLAGQVLHIFLSDSLLGAALLLGVSVFIGVSTVNLLREASFMCATLSVLAWPLRDHATRPGGLCWGTLLAGLLSAALGLGAVALASQPLWWALLLGASLAISGATIARRWNLMVGAPPAFPAGRFDSV